MNKFNKMEHSKTALVKKQKHMLGPMKKNSKFDPEIARILQKMEKKNR